ncbi:MAG TPA: hypothetical protein VK756_08005 [Solirubrobacteraceae bacterium]|jgi:hypothetical protein|nr:hypothetical protein [Solirubrobacteraceae bacterium]
MGRRAGYALLVALVLALLGAAGASVAGAAAPVWKLDGNPPTGTEKIIARAVDEQFVIPGLTTECAHATMVLGVTNRTSFADAEVEEFLNEGCATEAGSKCHVERFEAKKLPWPAHRVTVSGKEYLVLEDVHIEARYSGSECAFAGETVTVKGSAGGLIENTTETITFDKATASATGTSLKVGSSAVEWDALFLAEGIG